MRSLLSNWGAIAAVVILVAAQAAAVNYLGRNNYLPEGSDHWTEDWLIHYFSKRLDKPHKDVALVLVDAESLEKAGLPARIPVDRGWMARLVAKVAKLGPAAIGVDFYFASPIDAKDEQLIAAIRDAPAPIVLAAVDDTFLRTDGQRAFQRDFIKRVNRPAGHIYFKRSKEIFTLGDRATRGVDHGPSADGYPSLTSTLASLPAVAARFGAREIPEGTQRIDWLLAPQGGDAITRISAHEILSPAPGAEPPALKNKIVLIGPNFAGLDQLSVPFALGSDQALYPGVFVHAQALAQILDGRFFFNWTSWQQFFLLFAIGVLGAAVGWYSRLDIVIGIGGSLLLIALSAPMFMVHAPLPTALAILSWAFSISIAQRIKSWQGSWASEVKTVSGRSAS
ncbi:MAG: CHASE2 domain-containing protein [Rhodomicrobium sp.]